MQIISSQNHSFWGAALGHRTWASLGCPNRRRKQLPPLCETDSSLLLESHWGSLWTHTTYLQTSLTREQQSSFLEKPHLPWIPCLPQIPCCLNLSPRWSTMTIELVRGRREGWGEAGRGDWSSGRQRFPGDEWGEPWRTGLHVGLHVGRRFLTLA